VAVLNAAEYSERIEALLLDGLLLFRLQVLGRSILLKPNLVEDLPGPVNTNSALIGAAARCFLRLGAARVVIGEGPGHQRDTELVLQAAGLKPHLAERQIEFVDLNRDELRKVKLKANYSGLGELWLPSAVLESDFVVSMPKVKTHHWAGVTLSLKNMFGVVPGAASISCSRAFRSTAPEPTSRTSNAIVQPRRATYSRRARICIGSEC
jgi:uncharacterized protein (DUF362 family)